MKSLYLILFILGTVLPLSQFYVFFMQSGLDIPLFIEQLFANKISSFFAWDVIVSALVTVLFIETERRKKAVKNYAFCYIALFCAGVSSGLPLFLYLKEK
jgi:Terpene cyclase DEP1